MSCISECLATPHEFTHKGKTYKVGLITQKVKADFEKKLFAKAKEAAATLKELMDKSDYLAHLKALNDDYISGAYAFESERGIAAVGTISGFTVLAGLLFGCDEHEILNLVTERSEEVKMLIQTIFHESFPSIEQRPEAKEGDAPKKLTGGGSRHEAVAARTRAIYARLLDHFHLDMDQIARLTDYQIHELYDHERDEETGKIVEATPKRVARPETLEDELRLLDMMHAELGIANLEEARQQLRNKWQANS